MSDIAELADALAAESSLKLWSVLVTCLGDVSRDGRTEVSGRALSGLVERVGLQSQAMRVALHRLKRDGWVESRREGRVSLHALSSTALAQTRDVAPRIYGPGTNAEVHLVGLPPDTPDGMPVGIPVVVLSRGIALACGPRDALPETWLAAKPCGLPTWARTMVEAAACEREFAALDRALARIDTIPEAIEDRIALRTLVLHGWRRLILRSNPAAEAALGMDRSEAACRVRVLTLLQRLGSVPVSWCQAR